MPLDSKQKTLFQSWKHKIKEPNKTKLQSSTKHVQMNSNNNWQKQSSSKRNEVVELSSDDIGDNDLLSATIALENSQNMMTDENKISESNIEKVDGFDNFAGKLWIYPTNYPVRTYQHNIVHTALYNNTLVALPTGLGKTFIAAVVMYNFYRWYPQGKVVFMAPTKPLVSQQIDACYNIMGIPMEDQVQMTGSSMASNRRQELWNTKRVFFLTPQVINNDLGKGVCSAESIKCLVFDEAHKALGNQAYCQVIQQVIGYSRDFRVLALSATPGTDIRAVQQVIKNLLISKIEIRSEDSIDIKQYTHSRIVSKIVVKLGDQISKFKEKYIKVIEVFIDNLVRCKALYNQDVKYLSKYRLLMARDQYRKDPPTGISRQVMGIIEGDFAMSVSLYHGLELLLQHGMKSFFIFLKGIMDGNKGNMRVKSVLSRNPDFRYIYDELILFFGSSPSSSVLLTQAKGNARSKVKSEPDKNLESMNYVYSHPKINELEKIVLKHFTDWKNDPTKDSMATRVMVFCQYRDSVHEITELLQTHRPLLKPMQFVGHAPPSTPNEGATPKTSSGRRFTQKDQLMVVEKFRSGGYNILVSTCVGEEGLDIGDVDLIVCFDSHKSPIRLVQRMGRTGRKREGRIVMLVTEGKEERDYNSSVASKKTIHKAITGNAGKSLQYYPHNPRMVPVGLNPTCHQMFITVAPQASKPIKNKKVSTKKLGNNLDVSVMLKKGSEKTRLTSDQLKVYQEKYQYYGNVKTLQMTGKCLSLKNTEEKFEELDSSKLLSLSEWIPWQCRPQKTTFGHSYSSTMLSEILQMSIGSTEKALNNDVKNSALTSKSKTKQSPLQIKKHPSVCSQNDNIKDKLNNVDVIDITDDVEMENVSPPSAPLPPVSNTKDLISVKSPIMAEELKTINQPIEESQTFSLSDDLSPLFPSLQYTDSPCASPEQGREREEKEEGSTALCDIFNLMEEPKKQHGVCFNIFDSDSNESATVFDKDKTESKEEGKNCVKSINVIELDESHSEIDSNDVLRKKDTPNDATTLAQNNPPPTPDRITRDPIEEESNIKTKKSGIILEGKPHCLTRVETSNAVSFDASSDMFGGQFDLDFNINSQPLTQPSPHVKKNNVGADVASNEGTPTKFENIADAFSLDFEFDSPKIEPSKNGKTSTIAEKNANKNKCDVSFTRVKRLENRALFADLSSNSSSDTLPFAAVKPLHSVDEASSSTVANPGLKRRHNSPLKCDSPELYFGDDSDFEDFLLEPKKRKIEQEIEEDFYPESPIEFVKKKKRAALIESDTSCYSDAEQSFSASKSNLASPVLATPKFSRSHGKLGILSKAKLLDGGEKHSKHSTPKMQLISESSESRNKTSKHQMRLSSFVDDEAELSGDDSTDDDDITDDVMDAEMLEFFNDASQLTQHVGPDETRQDEQAMYLRSFGTDKFKPSDVENFKGKFKLVYNRGLDVDVFSQEGDLNDTNYENDSFCVDDNEVERTCDLGEITLLEPCSQIMTKTKATTRSQAKQSNSKSTKPIKSNNKKVQLGRRRLIICEEDSDNSFLDTSNNSLHRHKEEISETYPTKPNHRKKEIDTPDPRHSLPESSNSFESLSERHCELCGKLLTTKGWMCRDCVAVVKRSEEDFEPDAKSELSHCASNLNASREERVKMSLQKHLEFKKKRLSNNGNLSSASSTSSPLQLPAKKLLFTPSPKVPSVSRSTVPSSMKKSENKTECELSIIVDSRELSTGANQLAQYLRTKQKVHVVVASLRHNGFILGHRCAALRKSVSDVSSPNNKLNILQSLRKLQEYFSKVFLIIEKDRVKKGLFGNEKATVSQMSNFRSTVLNLTRENVEILYSDNQNQTAELLYRLAKRDQQKLKIDRKFIHQRENAKISARISVFQHLPSISYLSAIYLAQSFKSFKAIALSSAESIEEKCKVTPDVAETILNFFHKTFDEQMTTI